MECCSTPAASPMPVGSDARPSAAASEEPTSAAPLEERRGKMEVEPELEDVCPTGSAVSLPGVPTPVEEKKEEDVAEDAGPPVQGPMAGCGRPDQAHKDCRKLACGQCRDVCFVCDLCARCD